MSHTTQLGKFVDKLIDLPADQLRQELYLVIHNGTPDHTPEQAADAVHFAQQLTACIKNAQAPNACDVFAGHCAEYDTKYPFTTELTQFLLRLKHRLSKEHDL